MSIFSFKLYWQHCKRMSNSLLSRDAIWWHSLGPILVQVMAFAWLHQAITWSYVDFSVVGICGIHLRANSQRVPQLLLCIMSSKIIFLRLQPHLPGTTELRAETNELNVMFVNTNATLSDIEKMNIDIYSLIWLKIAIRLKQTRPPTAEIFKLNFSTALASRTCGCNLQ